MKNLILESINKNPIAMKDTLEEALRERITQKLQERREELTELSPETLKNYVSKLDSKTQKMNREINSHKNKDEDSKDLNDKLIKTLPHRELATKKIRVADSNATRHTDYTKLDAVLFKQKYHMSKSDYEKDVLKLTESEDLINKIEKDENFIRVSPGSNLRPKMVRANAIFDSRNSSWVDKSGAVLAYEFKGKWPSNEKIVYASNDFFNKENLLSYSRYVAHDD